MEKLELKIKKYLIINIIFIILLLLIVIVPCSLSYVDEKQIEITITDKYTKGEDGTYFIVDNNDNAYVIKDLIFIGKFNSTDIYNKLKIGCTYKVKVSGVRIHFLSMYQNINEIIKE